MTVVSEGVIAHIDFMPYFEEDSFRTHWRVDIELIDEQHDGEQWPRRIFRGTISNKDTQLCQHQVPRIEGGRVRDDMERLCHTLGQWYAFPDYGAYSIDWLCGYMAGARDKR